MNEKSSTFKASGQHLCWTLAVLAGPLAHAFIPREKLGPIGSDLLWYLAGLLALGAILSLRNEHRTNPEKFAWWPNRTHIRNARNILLFVAAWGVIAGAYHLIWPQTDLKLSNVHTNQTSEGLVVDTFSVSNGAFIDLKDPLIACDMKGPSGTVIKTAEKILYEPLPAETTRQFETVFMGPIPDQVVEFTCYIKSVRVKW
jgi:hypothetical protein